MKLIGVLGGTSWPSTMLLYRLLNEHVSRVLGAHHSARILLYSIDYHAIKSRYWDKWDEVPALLSEEIGHLLSRRPDCWILANNTLHKAYDAIAHALDSDIPFFHAVKLTHEHVEKRGFRKVLLLGTRFTMEDGFFASPFEAAGIRVLVPGPEDRERVQQIQTRLARGEEDPGFRAYFASLIEKERLRGCDAVITACTELPLAIDQSLTSLEVIDPLALQSRACIEFAIGQGGTLAAGTK